MEEVDCSVHAILMSTAITLIIITTIKIFGCDLRKFVLYGMYYQLTGLSLAAMLAVPALLYYDYMDVGKLTPSFELVSFQDFKILYLLPMFFMLIFHAGILMEKARKHRNYEEEEKPKLPFASRVTLYFICPIVEEYIFRHLIMTLLTTCIDFGGAIIFSSLLFAISHAFQYIYVAHQSGISSKYACFYHSLVIFAYGFFLGMIYLRSMSIVSSMCLHIVINYLSRLRRLEAGRDPLMKFVDIVGGVTLLICLYFYLNEFENSMRN